MRRLLLPALLVCLSACDTEGRRARRAAEAFSRTPDVQEAIGRQEADIGVPPNKDLTEVGRIAYAAEAAHIIDSLISLGDSTRARRAEMYRNVGATRARIRAELDSAGARFTAGRHREDSLVRASRHAHSQADRDWAWSFVGDQMRKTFADSQDVAWLRRVLSDSALPDSALPPR